MRSAGGEAEESQLRRPSRVMDGPGSFSGRSNRALQRRQLVQHGCSREELARTEGFEPPPSGSVIRRIIQFCYVRVFLSAESPVTAGKLVETAGNAPAATILQGSSAPLCCPRGAEGWFRANLPASSARCFHQISFLGTIGAGVGVGRQSGWESALPRQKCSPTLSCCRI